MKLFSRNDPFAQLVSHSPGLEAVIRSAQIAASADITVLIHGETGTGKDLLSQAIHEASPRASKPMITVNCAALSDTLLESQLFGHVEGAFTGAVSDSTGYVQAADGGTLFLDEIGELSSNGQAALLRFLESGECQRVGALETLHVDCRVIAATHRNLQQMVDEGEFRQDLFYRLNVVTLQMPPLRARPGDIPVLVNFFTEMYAEKQTKAPLRFDRSAMKRLEQHDWPGNVRQLRNLCARMVTLKPDGASVNSDDMTEELAIQSSSIDSSLFELPTTGIKLEEVEIDLIKQALEKAEGNKSKAAKLLGITRDAFMYRIKKHDI